MGRGGRMEETKRQREDGEPVGNGEWGTERMGKVA